MITSIPTSPARLTASATLKLPRWGLFLLSLLYVLPGLFGRGPWKIDDATGFGVMLTMARGHLIDWLAPNVMGAPVFDSGPLAYWVGALFIRCGALVGLDPSLSARGATVVFFLLAATALWYAAYLLGRLPGAQPLPLAFGGHPAPRDYGRTLADGALLVLLATLGLAARAHETSSDAGMLAMLCVTLYGMARSLDRPYTGAAWLALGLAGTVLTRGPWPAGALLLAWIVLLASVHDLRAARTGPLALLVGLAALLLLFWPLVFKLTDPASMQAYFEARRSFWLSYADGIGNVALRKYVRNLGWFALPAWPIAFWCLWSWRRQLRRPHLLIPVAYLVAVTAAILSTSDDSDGLILMLLPGLVLLAGFGLPTLKRGAANAIDWCSLLMYSLAALGLWATWFTRQFGVPAAYAHSLERLVPGLAPSIHPVELVLALCLTAAWIWLVRWRVVTHPKVLWRSVVLASAGVTLCWGLAMTLLMPELDYSRSYREVALKLYAVMPEALRDGRACAATDGVGLAQRASFAYFADVHFQTIDWAGKPAGRCTYLLIQDLNRGRALVRPAGSTLVWEGRRPSDRDERYRLYRLAAAQ